MASQESATRSVVSPRPQPTPQVWAPPISQGWMGSCDVPDKIRKRILDLEYMNVGELLPEMWNMQGLQCCHQARTSRRGPVTNLLLWLEGYSILVAVLSSKYPEYTGELMAYQRWIIWAASNFVGSAWVTYDICYRCCAARMKSLSWSREDITLAQEAFAGRARAVARCSFCLS